MSPSCCISLLGLRHKVPETELAGLNERTGSRHGSGGQKCKVSTLAELVSSEGCEGESVPCLCPSFW